MWLQEAEHSNDTRFNFIVKMLLSILACAVLTLNITKISGFDQIYQLPVMTLTGSFLCCAYGIAEKYEKKNWFYLSVLAVLLLFVLIFRNFVLEGFRLFWNQQGNYRTMGTGYVVSKLETLLAQEQAGKALFCFSFFAGVFCAIVCCLLNKIMSVLLPMILLAGMIYFGHCIAQVLKSVAEAPRLMNDVFSAHADYFRNAESNFYGNKDNYSSNYSQNRGKDDYGFVNECDEPSDNPFYAVLSAATTSDELKKIYHDLAKKLHPDVCKDYSVEESTAQMSLLNSCYESLCKRF